MSDLAPTASQLIFLVGIAVGLVVAWALRLSRSAYAPTYATPASRSPFTRLRLTAAQAAGIRRFWKVILFGLGSFLSVNLVALAAYVLVAFHADTDTITLATVGLTATTMAVHQAITPPGVPLGPPILPAPDGVYLPPSQ